MNRGYVYIYIYMCMYVYIYIRMYIKYMYKLKVTVGSHENPKLPQGTTSLTHRLPVALVLL